VFGNYCTLARRHVERNTWRRNGILGMR